MIDTTHLKDTMDKEAQTEVRVPCEIFTRVVGFY